MINRIWSDIGDSGNKIGFRFEGGKAFGVGTIDN
jgi:hypothetical protein